MTKKTMRAAMAAAVTSAMTAPPPSKSPNATPVLRPLTSSTPGRIASLSPRSTLARASALVAWSSAMTAAASARVEIADFVGAAFSIYALIVIAWIVANLLFSLGVSVPFSRPANAVLDFLRDCSEPYLRIFRRLPLQVGPLDLSPIVAIFVLQIIGLGVIVALIEP